MEEENKKPVWLDCVAVFVGLLVGGILIAGVERIGHMFYEPPKGIENADFETLKMIFTEYIETAPTMALVFPILAHAVGVIAAGFIVSIFRRPFWLVGCLIVGGFFMIAGVANLYMIPHPQWFMIADLLVYLPGSIIGGLACQRIFPRDGG